MTTRPLMNSSESSLASTRELILQLACAACDEERLPEERIASAQVLGDTLQENDPDNLLRNLRDGIDEEPFPAGIELALFHWPWNSSHTSWTTWSRAILAVLLFRDWDLKPWPGVASSYDFSKFTFPAVRGVHPNLIAQEIFSIQPMPFPSSRVFYLDYTYGGSDGIPLPSINPDLPPLPPLNSLPPLTLSEGSPSGIRASLRSVWQSFRRFLLD